MWIIWATWEDGYRRIRFHQIRILLQGYIQLGSLLSCHRDPGSRLLHRARISM